jgi:hypothetical protein
MAIQATQVFGALGIEDDDYLTLRTIGQDVVLERTMDIIQRHNAAMAEYERIFVERDTIDPTILYYVTVGGRMEKISDITQPKAVKVAGNYTVGFPIEEFGAKIAGNRVQMAYMSAALYGRHIASILNSDVNERRFNILKPLFNNAPPAFNDQKYGTVTLYPLANGDTTYYPPTVESDVAATANHYLNANYATTAISDANNPIEPMITLLESRFGLTATGSNIVVFMNNAQVAKVKALTDFYPFENRFVNFGDTISVASNIPGNLPGVPFGTYDGRCILQRWDRIPAAYMVAMNLDQPPPLMRRVDRPESGLRPGLNLIQERVDEPLRDAWWSNRYGYAVGNRLNAVVIFIDAGGAYVIPTQFA